MSLIPIVAGAQQFLGEALAVREILNATRDVLLIGIVVTVVVMITCALVGNRKNSSIRSTLLLMCVVFAALFVTIAVMVQLHIGNEIQQQKIDKLRLRSIGIAHELKQSSDDLTRFVRYYCVTGNPIYEDYFHRISEIRDGKRPHPSNFSLSYWDYVMAGTREIDEQGETYAIEEKMLEFGLTEQEQAKLTEAKVESDDLINLETVAMNAVKGRFQDANGQFTIEGAPDLKLAQSIVFGPEYHASKSKIMKPIDEFINLLNARIREELIHIHQHDKDITHSLAIFTFIALGVVTCFMLLMVRKIIGPLRSLEKAAKRVAMGRYEMVPPSGKQDEVGRLTDAFNFMVSERRIYEDTLKSSEEETRRALKRLEESETHYRSLVTNIPGTVYRCALDEDWTMHYLSNHIEELSGYPASDFIENRVRSYASIIHPDDQQVVSDSVHTSIEKTGFYIIEYRIIRSDGEVRWVFERGHVIKGSEGDVRYLDGFIMDISERKRAEEILKMTLSHLEESEQQLDLVIKAAGLVVWKIDFKNPKIYFTPLFEEIFGYQPGEYLDLDQGKWCPFKDEQQEFRSFVHPDDLELFNQQRSRFFEQKQELDFQFRAQFADQRWRWLRIYGCVTEWDAKNEAQSAHGVIIDVDKMKRLQLELITAKEEAEAASRAKSIFLANMSHEIRTPMNAILGHSQILQRDKKLSPTQLKSVRSIQSSGEHLLAVINDILDMSKIEAGKMSLSPTSFDLIHTLRELEAMFAAKAKQKGLGFVVEYATDLPRVVFADEYRLKQVLINLLGNAFKFTLSGSVRVSASRKEDLIRICVSDTGCGIASDYLDTIFGAFSQSESGRRFAEGAGLGLAISRNIAHMMGGDITVRSDKGKGSEFSFLFRYELGQPEALLSSNPERIVSRIRPGQREIKVLIVDDKEENRNVARLMLEPIGFSIKEAVNGEDGLIIAEAWKPEIVLMDVAMPILDGHKASRILKKRRWGKGVKIIAVSASTMDEARKTMLENGADAFIKKPYREWELLKEIARCTGIEYDYEEIQVESEPSAETAPLDVTNIPNDLRTTVRKAALLGDVTGVKETIDRLSNYDQTIADHVNSLLEDYQFRAIYRLFED